MKTVPFVAVLLALLLISCIPPAESGCDTDAGSASSGSGGAGGDGGACAQTYPQADEQLCNVDSDCPSDGACYDMRCLSLNGVKRCQPLQFRENMACHECGHDGLCDWNGFCQPVQAGSTVPQAKPR